MGSVPDCPLPRQNRPYMRPLSPPRDVSWFPSRRPKNSLSFRKFMSRMNKGLPLFTTHSHGEIMVHTNIKDLQKPRLGWFGSDGPESWRDVDDCNRVSMHDINATRNDYNAHFAFRTYWAAREFQLTGE